ncbi:hypothetical protein V2O64_16325 [Verrucomicrobiaceae bacterium 227]
MSRPFFYFFTAPIGVWFEDYLRIRRVEIAQNPALTRKALLAMVQ